MGRSIRSASGIFVALVLAAAGWVTVPVAADLPADVKGFLDRREICDHFRGEAAEEPARQAEIAKALDRYCRGTDAALQKLKAEYKNGPAAVVRSLGAIEETIE